MNGIAISDTHALHRDLVIPDGSFDLLIHAGDATSTGTIREIIQFNKWLGPLKARFKHILSVPGNHDWLFQRDPNHARALLSNATVLIDQAITIDGIEFYGSPWQPEFCNWAFNLPRNGDRLKALWAQIPDPTHVLITHSPPFAIQDSLEEFNGAKCEFETVHLGCEQLRARVEELPELKHHFFGHIHEGYGRTRLRGIDFYNVSSCDGRYRPVNAPMYFEI